jgi:hypothetical protein
VNPETLFFWGIAAETNKHTVERSWGAAATDANAIPSMTTIATVTVTVSAIVTVSAMERRHGGEMLGIVQQMLVTR